MAAEKVVPGQKGGGTRRVMNWEKPSRDRYYWQAPLEVEAAQVGAFFVFVNPNFARAWCFKLSLRDEEVCRWDVRPLDAGHSNPATCPAAFPGRVTEREHEHAWVEGLDLKCARPLDDLASSGHRAIFEVFCKRTDVRFEPEYVAPEAFEQLEL